MIAIEPQGRDERPSDEQYPDTAWLRYFDPRIALAAVEAHIEQLPSSRTERHTARAYGVSLNYFLTWANHSLPTEDLMNKFVAHLVKGKRLQSTTIGRYLAPIRLYLKKLANQRMNGLVGFERDFVSDCRDHIRAASEVKTPPANELTAIAPLWNPKFHRLTLQQVNSVLRSIDRNTRAGLRDYALLHVAFSTALRLSELGRINLSAIRNEGTSLLLTVRGKRNNVDPVPMSPKAFDDIRCAVEAFNRDLPGRDRRRIQGTQSIWQPLLRNDDYVPIGLDGYDPVVGLSDGGIRKIIARRTCAALGAEFELAAHDTRRTAAALAYEAGMPLTDIQALLRHKSGAMTLKYIGVKPDYHSRTLGHYVWFG